MKRLISLPILSALISAGLANFLNNYTASFKADEVAVSYLFAGVLFIWGLFTVTIWQRVDEEWKGGEHAILHDDKEEFFRLAKIKMDKLVGILWWVITIACIISFNMFHFETTTVLLITHALLAFLLVTAVVFVKDRDDPLKGAVNLKLPSNWSGEDEA